MSNIRPRLMALVHSAVAYLILIIASVVAAFAYMLPSATMACLVQVVVYISTALGLVGIYVDRVLKLPLSDFHIGWPAPRPRWIAVAVLLPVLVSAYYLVFVPGVLTRGDVGAEETVAQVFVAVFVLGIGAGVVEEMIFRGLIMGFVNRAFGRTAAVVAPSVLFALIHLPGSGAGVGDAVLVVLAGTAVGIMFSLITLESGSIWSASVVHALWNVVMIGGILSIGTEHAVNNLWRFTPGSASPLITGGAFGVEAGLPAIVGYTVVIGYAMARLRRTEASTAL